jgi:6-phosphogluconolactonase
MGIYAFRYEDGVLEPLERAADSVNPSFLGIHPSRRFLYAVNEARRYNRQPGGGVSAFAFDGHNLAPLNMVSSQGGDPCHLTVDRTGRWLIVANYTGGSIAVFPIETDGSVREASQVVQHQGASGVNPARQEAPHVHSVDLSDDNRFLYVDDLGLDQILVYRFDNGKLTPHSVTASARGAGPRHLAFSPDRRFAYGMNELMATVSVYRHDPATAALEHFQMVPSLPLEYDGHKWGAEIAVHPGGRFLYASNRAHNSIAIFRISPQDGRITPAGHVPCGGANPRHFAIDPEGAHLVVANQDTGNLVSFRIDPDTGALTRRCVAEVPEPVCVLFV